MVPARLMQLNPCVSNLNKWLMRRGVTKQASRPRSFQTSGLKPAIIAQLGGFRGDQIGGFPDKFDNRAAAFGAFIRGQKRI